MPNPRASIKHNVLANYAAQIYTSVIGIVMAPVYLTFMGVEAYGLIGFFTMMTAWFQLLDMGLTPTIARETARFRGGAIGVATLRALLRALEAIFAAVSLVGAAVLVLLSNQIAVHWLNVKSLPIEQVAYAVMLMGLAVPLRWMSGLYRGVINGFEHQVWLSAYNIAIATARFVGVLIVFVTFGASPVYFFIYQLVVAVIELAGLVVAAYRLVQHVEAPREKFSWTPLTGNLAFSLTIAFSATAWVAVMQTDKLVLSRILPLAQYGVFSIAVVAAAAINAANAPFNQALLPRLTKLVAENDEAGVAALYKTATQTVCVLMVPAVAMLAFFAEPILRAWTGNAQIAHKAAPILRLYAIGNGCVSLNSFAYYIQYAKGDLRLHFVGQILLLVLLIPAYVFGATYYGGLGTGVAWAAANGLYALLWTPVVHSRMFEGHHWQWVTRDVLPIIVPTMLAGAVLAASTPWPAGRLAACIEALLAGGILLMIAAAGSSYIRGQAMMRFAPWAARIASMFT
jgi:O-antigen/teichoic acid export membrane protein